MIYRSVYNKWYIQVSTYQYDVYYGIMTYIYLYHIAKKYCMYILTYRVKHVTIKIGKYYF